MGYIIRVNIGVMEKKNGNYYNITGYILGYSPP